MEAIGHQLMALRVDEQMIDILQTQLVQMSEKLSLGWGQSMSTECTFLAEAAYYTLSFMQLGSMKGDTTPGMGAVSLGVADSVHPIDDANTLLVLSYLVLKWSLVKIQSISNLDGWSAASEGTLERRMHEVLKRGSVAVKCLSVLSYAVFLCRGDSPSMLYRLTGISMAPAAAATVPLLSSAGSTAATTFSTVSTVAAGYKNSQLFVEGKKMLWLALLGATAAASITIDWQALRYYLYFHTHSIMNALQGLRQYAGNSAPVRVICAYYVRVLRYISSLLVRTAAHSVYSAHSVNGGSNAAAEGADTGAEGHSIGADLIRERTETDTQQQTLPLQTQQQQCSACQLTPPEMPHSANCGHVYCYLCIHTHIHSAASANQFDILSNSGGIGASATCLVCYQSISTYTPQCV